jgi:hypothetical protein
MRWAQLALVETTPTNSISNSGSIISSTKSDAVCPQRRRMRGVLSLNIPFHHAALARQSRYAGELIAGCRKRHGGPMRTDPHATTMVHRGSASGLVPWMRAEASNGHWLAEMGEGLGPTTSSS